MKSAEEDVKELAIKIIDLVEKHDPASTEKLNALITATFSLGIAAVGKSAFIEEMRKVVEFYKNL